MEIVGIEECARFDLVRMRATMLEVSRDDREVSMQEKGEKSIVERKSGAK
jgi:hypothetical protein